MADEGVLRVGENHEGRHGEIPQKKERNEVDWRQSGGNSEKKRKKLSKIKQNPMKSLIYKKEKKNGLEENIRGCVYNRRKEEKKSIIVGAEFFKRMR